MRDPNRIDEFIECLRAIWKANPDMRFTQLIINAYGQDPIVYYAEDDEALKQLKRIYLGQD